MYFKLIKKLNTSLLKEEEEEEDRDREGGGVRLVIIISCNNVEGHNSFETQFQFNRIISIISLVYKEKNPRHTNKNASITSGIHYDVQETIFQIFSTKLKLKIVR